MIVSRETLLANYFKESAEKIDRYVQILQSWGIERGLIGPREGDRIWDRHIANCLPVASLIPSGVKVADIGSGAGLPGIVLALARPDLHLTLIEPLQRRVDFLNEVVTTLGLPISVVRGRAESVKQSFEVVTARALAPLPKLLTISWHLVKPGGALLAMKGESAQEEIDITPPRSHSTTQLHLIELPEMEISRVIEVRKTA